MNDDRHAWANAGTEDLGHGLYRIPLPLPGDALTAVNVYAMTGAHGVDLIDSGMAIVQARERLTGALGALGYGLPDIRNFFITHVHHDHYTLALELRTTLHNVVALGEGERANLDAIKAAAAGRGEGGFIEQLVVAGAPEDLSRQVRELMNLGPVERDRTTDWSDPDRWLTDGTVLELPGRTLRAINTPGHTRGHLVFHDEAASQLFAGDHVLPHITPSIGFQPAVTRLALDQYLGSLRLMLMLPDARLLPAHGPVQDSTHRRVNELLEHHDKRLAQTLEAATGGPVTAFQVAAVLPWTRREKRLDSLDPVNQFLATGETMAHLEVLVLRGELVRETSPEGVETFQVPPGDAR